MAYTEEQLEAEITAIFKECGDDFDYLDDYLSEHDDDDTIVDVYELAFRIAVRQGNTEYINEHYDEIELNDGDGCSTYLDETDDDYVKDLLMNLGAFRSWDDYDGYRFAIESINWSILSFDSDFQSEVYEKYIEQKGLTDNDVVGILSGSIEENDDDEFDVDEIQEDLSNLGVSENDGEICFEDMYSEDGIETMRLLEELDYSLDFEGQRWKLETNGVFFIE